MSKNSTSFNEYIAGLPEDRKEAVSKLRTVINKHLPQGFEEGLSYGMHGWIVPFSEYPEGYHCKTDEPLPFLSIASQKNFIGLYHMGMYSDPKLLEWFQKEYPNHAKYKLDMGKSCVRFKRMEDIPLELIGELVAKMSMQEWIDIYEKHVKR